MTRSRKQKDLLWAPWRKEYLRSSRSKPKGCLFCRLLKGKKDRRNLVVFRGRFFALILNRYPYNNGHILIVPNRHIACPSQLNSAERSGFFDILDLAQSALQKALNPQGYNMGANLADVAGAGIPEHLHWHLVPRWKGDVNFMPVIAGIKVISESLDSVYTELQKQLKVKNKKQ